MCGRLLPGGTRSTGGKLHGDVEPQTVIGPRAIEDQLRVAEARLRMLVDDAADGIFIADANGRYLDVNPAGCAMLGYSLEQMLALSMVDIIASEEHARLGTELAKLFGGIPIKSEWRFRRKDGSHFFGEINGRRLPDSRFIGVLRDISDRKRVEEQLRDSEARYRLIVENQTEFIVKWLPDGTRTFVNEHYCRLFGLTEEECIGTSFWPLVAPEHRDAIRVGVAALRPGREEFTDEHVSYAVSGPRWQQWTTRGIFDTRNRLVELLSTGRDITERKIAEDRLLQSETHLLTTQRIASIGSWEMDVVSMDDPRLGTIRWSSECHRLLGYGLDDAEMSFAAFYRRVHPDDRAKVREAFRRAFYNGTAYSIDHRVVLGDGTERVLHEQAECVLDPATGMPAKFIGTTQDITGRVQLEDQLRQSQKMQAIGQLAGGVAHDFNNLLTVINGYSEMLLSDGDERGPARNELAAIRDAGERAAQLTRQLLLFSRKAVLEPRELDVNDLVQHVGVLLRRLISEDIELQLTLAPSLPAITADPSQLEQVVVNLALNGRDAMEQGGRVSIATAAVSFDDADCRAHPEYRPGHFVRLTVKDNGCGMTPHTKAHLFEPFFTTKAPGKGIGLGLATVYGIVHESNGFITVTSDVGAGTTMNVFLPSLDKPTLPGPEPPGEDEVLKGEETVLLVEDEDAVRSVATLALRLRGYQVMAAGDGPAALRLLEGEHRTVDLLLTDVVMPEMSGGQLADAVRKRFPSCRVLFMSGYNEDMTVRRGQVARNAAFLQKPFTPLILARKVRETLDAEHRQ
jgi:two-component system, cell cycle sensor histidine kinase and response regulator CckA